MNAPAAIGDNRPALVSAEQLGKDYAYVEKAIADLEAKASDIPPVIEDDEDLTAIHDFAVKLRGALKRVEELRDENKRPHLDAGRVIDAFFKLFAARVEKVKTDVEKRGQVYLQKKAEAERKRRAEEERKAREQAERQRQAAQAALAAPTPDNSNEKVAAIEAAAEAENEAREAAAATQAKPADLARTHTAAGTATLAEELTHVIEDWNKIDWTVLGPFIRRDEADKAIRALIRSRQDDIKAGRFRLAGVTFKSATRAQFR